MSTLKSSEQDLTLNADGSGNDIKFQSNGSEVASIDQAGVLTAGGATLTGNIAHAGALTIDVGTYLYLDSDGAYIYLQDDGTSVGLFKLTSSDFYIKSVVSDKDLIFQGKDGASGITALTLDMSDAGVAKFNRGILFNNDTASENELDDYEEGTWTPAYTPNSGSFTTIGYTSGGAIGRYTKIGNLVTIMCQMGNTNMTVGTASGALRVTGLPYTPLNYSGANWGQGITSQNWGGDNPMGVQIRGNETRLDMLYRTTANGTVSALNVTDMDTGGDSNYTRFTLAYITG